MLGGLGTFSILAPESGLLGAAVASGSPSVGDRVPHAKPGVGVAVTQAYTDPTYGTEGLKLIGAGASPQEALDGLLSRDPGRELRQVAFMDFKGNKAFFTGSLTPGWRGASVGKNHVVIGNLLAGERVLRAMVPEFERSRGSIAERMVRALRAAREKGGDQRGERSASLVVVDANRVKANVRIDDSEAPIRELSRKLEIKHTPF